MARRPSFVPQDLGGSHLETRVVLSTFNDIGNWFSSQYHHVANDLGVKQKHTSNAAAGIQELWTSNAKAHKAAATAVVHTPAVTSNTTILAPKAVALVKIKS